VELAVRPGVFLAASAASLRLSGVYVHASDSQVPTTLATPQQSQGRPFVLAVNSTMNVDHATFRYLGRDWNSSYGLSWSKGSTGSVVDSTFERNFIGVYTNGSPKLLVQHNTLTHNSLYGIDPHSGSTHMTIVNNTSSYNGRHGIIFSDHVTQGVVQGNTTIGNGLNGIMMDEASTGNLITGNTVRGNKSDGIVLAASDHNVIQRNTVLSNRIGITVRGDDSGNVITANSVRHNRMAIQGFAAKGNHLASNGGEWIGSRIRLIWIVTAAASLTVVMLTRLSQRGGRRRTPGRVTPRVEVAA
jgi:poly(beta-D-mannuronate) C5 epimerase